MTSALDMAFSAFETACRVPIKLDENKYPSRMSDFIRVTLGADVWDKQIEIADSVDDNRYTAVASCHGAGKSYIAARIALAFLHSRPHSVVISTAPTARQVQHVLWREINRAFRDAKFPLLGRCLTTRLEIAPDWYAIGFKAKTDGKNQEASDAFQGFHAENALVIFDEAAGVPEGVFESLEAVMTSENAKQLLIGNPTSVSGTFREAFHRNRSLYNTIKISAYDTPNLQAKQTIRPYLVTKTWVDTVIKKRGIKSPYVQSRVFANFPDLGVNKLIPLSWIEAANNREFQHTGERGYHVGLDIARYGDDESSIAIRRGSVFLEQMSWQGESVTASAKIANDFMRKYHRTELPIIEVRVDAIGLGAGVADILRETYGWNVEDVMVSMAASDPDEWPNFRHEMWVQLRNRFNIEEPRIAVAKGHEFDEDTIAQMCDIEYGYRDVRYSGMMIEPKEETKQRTGWSPDRAEAVALCYCTLPGPQIAAARPRAGVARETGWANAGKSRTRKTTRRRY